LRKRTVVIESINGWTRVDEKVPLRCIAACEECKGKTEKMFWRFEKPEGEGFGHTRMRCERCVSKGEPK
jgi:hypothetical protein